MESIKGSIVKIKLNDLQTGYTSFVIKHDGNVYTTVSGLIPDYPKGTPVIVEQYENISGNLSARSIKLYSDDKERTAAFLKNIGFDDAEDIVSVTGADIFSYFEMYDSIIIPGLDEKKCAFLVSSIKELLYRQKLYDKLFKNGADASVITRLYKEFGDETIEKLDDDPYLYTLIGQGSFDVSERLSKAKGMRAFDKKRVHAVVMTALMKNRTQGNTAMSFDMLLKGIHYIEKNAKQGYYTEPLFTAYELTKGGYYLDFSDDGLNIELDHDRTAELRIAGDVKRLYNSREDINKSGKHLSVGEIENALGIKYSTEQEEILGEIRESGLYIITGGPGTGKTTLLKGILYKYKTENPKEHVILAAPTGKAAARMSDATGEKASTIHRLLGIKPFEKDILDFKHEPIDAGLVVVDETSMLDTDIACVFLSCIKNGTTVLFLGDKDQLPSVGPGNILGDMIESGVIKSFSLKTIFRQKEGSVITENAGKVISGDTSLRVNDSFSVTECTHDKDVVDMAVALYHECKKKSPGSSVKIFSAVRDRKYPAGTGNINIRLFNDSGRTPLFSYGAYSYATGERVIFIRNNNQKGYYNGQEGIITGMEETGRGAYVYIENDEGEFALTESELSDIEPCYAITAHKAQGSECDTAIIAITKDPANMLLKKLLYVEITRAKKQVMIVSERDAYKDVISSRRDIKRNTGLVRCLREEFEKA